MFVFYQARAYPTHTRLPKLFSNSFVFCISSGFGSAVLIADVMPSVLVAEPEPPPPLDWDRSEFHILYDAY